MSASARSLSDRPMVRPRLIPAIRTAIVSTLICTASPPPLRAEIASLRATPDAHSLQSIVTQAVEAASGRFHIPATWVRAVMRAESDGDINSVSEKGAIGLMQLMPKTYAELRPKLGLGSDPFDPRDNILAGAAYLAEMFERYGATGFLAAYNAGPQRYEDFVLRGRALPAETTKYVARLAPQLGLTNTSIPQTDAQAYTHLRTIFVNSAALNLSDDASPKPATKPSAQHSQAAPHSLFSASSESNIFAGTLQTFGGPKAPTGATRMQPSGLFVARTWSKETP
jgi:hypothetical protein